MAIDFLLNVFKEYRDETAIIWKDSAVKYGTILDNIREVDNAIESDCIIPGTTIAVIGDFSPNSISIILSLIKKKCIIVPLNNSPYSDKAKRTDIAQVEFQILISDDDSFQIKKIGSREDNKYYNILRESDSPGLVLFTSGSSGEPKGAVHNFSRLLEKFTVKKSSMKTLNFLLFDHWGGLNTMFHILSNGGTLVTTRDRSPANICRLIEINKIELLPTSPTFLNLLLLSNAYNDYDLSSLKMISYGAEPMPETTLIRIKEIFPAVKLLQTYGLIELGVLRSKSESDNSLWVKLGGEGYQTRIVDGILQIKSNSTMLGYLNADSPFTEDGWFITGDQVLQKGEYIRILGRKSEIINVGGEKVYPVEVENVIYSMVNVADVTVYSEKNPIVGSIVCAKIRLKEFEDPKEFILKLKKYCTTKLEKFKVPVKVLVDNSHQHSERFKKIRNN